MKKKGKKWNKRYEDMSSHIKAKHFKCTEEINLEV